MGRVEFRNVNRDNIGDCVRFLDLAGSVDEFHKLKRRSLDLLQLDEGQSALDVGCGTGAQACAMAEEVGTTGRVIGVDLSAEMIAIAEARAQPLALPVSFQTGSVFALPFESGSFERCRIERLLHFLADPLQALREVARVTAAGGKIVACEPDWTSLRVTSDEGAADGPMLDALIADSKLEPRHGLEQLFVDAGLLVEHAEQVSIATTDIHVGLTLFQLENHAVHAIAGRRITARQGVEWLRSLQRAGASRSFKCSMKGHIVRGRKINCAPPLALQSVIGLSSVAPRELIEIGKIAY